MRIALAGEALIDFTGSGQPGSLAFQGHVGGGVLNSAIACARLGQPTAFLTQLSNDLFGGPILQHLQDNGVDTSLVTRSDAASTLAFVERTPTTNRYAFYRSGTADTQWAPDPLPVLPAGCRFLLFGSIALLDEPAAGHITALAEASRGQRIVVLDPNMRPSLIADIGAYRQRFARWLAAADLLKLSDEDCAVLAPGQAPEAAAAGWLAAPGTPGPRAVLLTRGAEGATLLRHGHASVSVRPPPVAVVDTIGAGDTFSAGLMCGLLERGVEQAAQLAGLPQADWDHALRLGVTAAALNCTRAGCNPPTRAEVAAAGCA